MSRFIKWLLCAAPICFWVGIACADISVVALTGQAVPGITGVTFSSLSGASVNNLGEIAFQARLSDGRTGIFKLSHGQISAIALSGQSMAGSPGLSFGQMGWPVINDSSAIAFIASIQGSTPNLQGLFVVSGASVNKVFDTVTTIPGTSDQASRGIQNPQLNNNGEMAITAYLASGTTAILKFSNGVVSSVIPDAQSQSFSLNNKGDIAFLGGDGGIHLFSGGINQLVIQSGQTVPNTTLVLNDLSGPGMNNEGDLVFVTNNTPIGLFSRIWQPNALIRWRNGTLERIVSANDPVPGTSNAAFVHIFAPLIDNSGRIIFISLFNINGSNGSQSSYGLFDYDNGNLSVLVQEGQTLAGVGKSTETGYYPDVNDLGIVTFRSSLDTGSSGIFLLNLFASQLFFPEVADGGYAGQWSWRTTLMLSNRDSSGAASISVSFFNDDGTPMNLSIQGTTSNQFTFTIPASGSLKIETSGIGSEKTGWAQVQSDKSVSGISIFSFYDGVGNYVSEMGAPSASAMSSFSMFVQSTTDINTGLAIANPISSPVQVTLTLRDSQGSTMGSPVSVTVPASGHIQGYVTGLFPQGTLPLPFQGTIDVTSQVPVIGLNMRQRGQAFTWLPLIQ